MIDLAIATTGLEVAMQDLVQAAMGWDELKAFQWMVAPNPHLGGWSPRDMIWAGRSHKLLAFINTAIDENGGPPPKGPKP